MQVGEAVTAAQAVARVPGGKHRRVHVLDVASTLGLPWRDLSAVMVKRRGDRVRAGDMIAARGGRLTLLYRPCRAPVDGQIVAIAQGWVVIETDSQPADIPALVAGRVAALRPECGVTIETVGAWLDGACGLGGEAIGTLRVAVGSPADDLAPEQITDEVGHALLVTGGAAEREMLERAAAVGAAGVIAGSIPVTLSSDPPLPVVAMEGYGQRRMSRERFDLLRSLDGRAAAISAPAGDARQRLRLAIVVPLPQAAPTPKERVDLARTARVGDRVRAVRAPWAGWMGEIVSLRDETGWTPSGFNLSGAAVRWVGDLSEGSGPERSVQWVPWLNLEREG